MSIVEPVVRRWTREEYYRMGEFGLFQDQRVELIDGEVVEMAPQKDVHAAAVSLVYKAASRAFGDRYWIRMQLPLQLGHRSEPEPDVSVVIGNERDYIGTGHPQTALLVIEVSDTTLRFDRKRKASLYASAGIADYWIVNLVDGQVEVYRDPIADAEADFGHRYAPAAIYRRGDRISPLAAAQGSATVDDLLP